MGNCEKIKREMRHTDRRFIKSRCHVEKDGTPNSIKEQKSVEYLDFYYRIALFIDTKCIVSIMDSND